MARLVAAGTTDAEIAAGLLVSPGTVKSRISHVQRKPGTRDRVGVAAQVRDSGLTP